MDGLGPGGSVLSKDDAERMKKEFEAIDVNKDNTISKEELLLLWRRVFPHLTEEETTTMAEEVLRVADTDGDGNINFEEFMDLCTMDNSLRFDVCFVRYQRRKAEDQLGLAIYVPFLILFVYFLVTGKALGKGYWLSRSITDSITEAPFQTPPIMYADIGNSDDMWDFMNMIVIPQFWQGEAGDNARRRVLNQQSVAIGALKFRQMRVKNVSCSTAHNNLMKWQSEKLDSKYISDRTGEFSPSCYPEFEDGSTDDQPFGLGIENIRDKNSPWLYRDCAGLNGAGLYTGKNGRYGCDGHALIIPFNKTREEATNMVQELKNNSNGFKWIDDSTRAVMLEFIVYNQNIRIFARTQMLMEYTAGGAVVPTRQYTLFQLHQWKDQGAGYWLFFFIFFLYVLSYFVAFCVDLRARHIALINDTHSKGIVKRIKCFFNVFFSDPWLGFDLLNLAIFIGVFALRFSWMAQGLGNGSPLQTSEYPQDYETVAALFATMSQLDAMNGLLCFIRIFYFLRLNQKMNLLTKTVDKALPELVGIVCIFAIVFAGFALMSLVAFGHVLEDFRDMPSTISTLSRMLVGDSDYVGMREERRVFTGIFYVLFMIVSVFLLLNMIIAVLSSAFEAVQEEKYDFGPILTIMNSVNSPELAERSIFTQIGGFPVFLEIKFWLRRGIYIVLKLFKKLTPEEYAARVNTAQNQCPRFYWGRVEQELLERKVLIDFRSKLKLSPVALEACLHEAFGEDLTALRTGLVKPTVNVAGFSERDLILDLVEFHHYWRSEVESYCELGEPKDENEQEEGANNEIGKEMDDLAKQESATLTSKKSMRGNPGGGNDARVDEVIKRLDRMKGSRREVVEAIKAEVCESVEAKMTQIVQEQMRNALAEVVLEASDLIVKRVTDMLHSEARQPTN
eukprot:PhF_6_TR31137/c0_g1_i2/m.45597/K04986/PKD2; polycystin 2